MFIWRGGRPGAKALPGLQKDFQDQLQRRVKDLRDNARKSVREKRRSQGQDDQPPTGQQKPRLRTRVETRAQSDGGGSSHSEALSVVVDEDGRITVKVTRNGNRTEYTFKDEADFEAREPELFKRYQKMSE
jgi:hypothetical protein